MTFSLAGRCARTGMLGVAVTTSSIAVGSRCAFVRAGVGAVLTQHRTDPTLGPAGLDLLQAGHSAEPAIHALAHSTPHGGWRQLAAIDAAGHTAFFHGANIHSIHGAAQALDCVAIGNILANDSIPAAMVAAFAHDPEAHLADRLLRGLEAGLDAGGENNPLRSAGLLVAHRLSFPYVDLRVDWADAPIAALRELWTVYAPQAEIYVTRAIDPDAIGPKEG